MLIQPYRLGFHDSNREQWEILHDRYKNQADGDWLYGSINVNGHIMTDCMLNILHFDFFHNATRHGPAYVDREWDVYIESLSKRGLDAYNEFLNGLPLFSVE
jgi:hypothetical protein